MAVTDQQPVSCGGTIKTRPMPYPRQYAAAQTKG